MRKLIFLSLFVNVVVLVPVCSGLLLDAQWAQRAYGGNTAARGILLAVYVAILVASLLLLVRPDPNHIAPLLFVQVVYKLLTPITVGTFVNPAVASNLLIAALHTATLVAIWKHTRMGLPTQGFASDA